MEGPSPWAAFIMMPRAPSLETFPAESMEGWDRTPMVLVLHEIQPVHLQPTRSSLNSRCCLACRLAWPLQKLEVCKLENSLGVAVQLPLRQDVGMLDWCLAFQDPRGDPQVFERRRDRSCERIRSSELRRHSIVDGARKCQGLRGNRGRGRGERNI